MKKVLVVLLIAVLAVSAVFADVTGFTGKLTSTVTYDTNAESLKLDQKAEVTGSFGFGLFNGSEASKASQGEKYPYAVIEGALSIDFEDFEFSFGDKGFDRYSAKDSFWNDDHTTSAQLTGELTSTETGHANFDLYDVRDVRYAWSETDPEKVISKAAIVGENWEVDLLKNFGEGDFAKNTINDTFKFEASSKVSSSVAYNMYNAVKAGNGVTFTYDGYSVAVNRFKFDEGNSEFALSLQSKDFEVAEGLVVTAGANYKVDSTYKVQPSVKVAYDANDVNAVVAADFSFSDADPEYDVSVDAAYLEDAVTFDFYYATKATAKSPYSDKAAVNKAVYNLKMDYSDASKATWTLKPKTNGDLAKYDFVGAEYYIEDLMSAKVAVDVAKLASLGEVSALSVTVDGHDILNKDWTAADANNKNAYAWNAEVKGAVDSFGTTAKFGAKKFTVDTRTFYAEATTDFAKFVALPVNTLTLTVGSNDLDMDQNTSSVDCLYAKVESEVNDVLTVALTGNKLAGIARTDKVGVSATFKGVENLVLSGKVTHEFAADSDKNTFVEAKAAYTCDLFTAETVAQAKFKPDTDSTFGLYVGAKSTTIVDGATLSLAFSGLDDDGNVKNNWVAKNYGNIVAKCVIAF